MLLIQSLKLSESSLLTSNTESMMTELGVTMSLNLSRTYLILPIKGKCSPDVSTVKQVVILVFFMSLRMKEATP